MDKEKQFLRREPDDGGEMDVQPDPAPRTRLQICYRWMVAFGFFMSIWNTAILSRRLIAEWQSKHQINDPDFRESLCPQEEPLWPSNHPVTARLQSIYQNSNFSAKAAEWLGGAVRVPTEVYDDYGEVESDARWSIFGLFHSYLSYAFPKAHHTLSLAKVNKYGLLYTWHGSDPSLMPILMMNHQDVVPVDPNTYSRWEEPPFSGLLKDGWIWGRGTCDDKNGLIGNLAAVELLLEAGFQPRRTVVFAFGFDEEASGAYGAGELSRYLKENGPQEFAFIIDEGGMYVENHGAMFAAVGVSEKGYLDVEIKVASPGGHSSIPPAHTAIGLLSQLIAHLEAHPHPAKLTRSSTPFQQLQCLAAHAPDLPSEYQSLILKASRSNRALKALEKAVLEASTLEGREFAALLGTTQAVDLISGGIKVNALPEETKAVVNHRISADSSVQALKDAITSLFTSFTAERRMTLNAFGRDVHDHSPLVPVANVTISEAFGSALEPAPTSSRDTAAWKVLSGTIKSVYKDAEGHDREIAVTPMLMGGNTDTKSYWSFSRNIFRYTHVGLHHTKNGFHTVNEAIKLEGFENLIKFFATLILNADEAQSL